MRPPAPLMANFVGISPLLPHARVHVRARPHVPFSLSPSSAYEQAHRAHGTCACARTARARACTRAPLAGFPRAHTAAAHSAHAHAHALPHTRAPPARSSATCPRIHLPLLSTTRRPPEVKWSIWTENRSSTA